MTIWQRRLGVGLFFSFCLSLLLALPAPAAAQTSNISLEVHVGYNESYRVGSWFPIWVVIGNDGPDTVATIEWAFSGNNAPFLREVELPRGARKQVVFYARSESFSRTGELVVRTTNNPVVRESVRMNPVEQSGVLVGTLSTNPAFFNSLNGAIFRWDVGQQQQPFFADAANVVSLQLEHLPDQVMGLRGLDMLVVHDVALNQLTAEQLQALRLWVQLGGILIVSGGLNAEQTTAGISDLLPVEIGPLEGEISLAPLLGRIASAEPSGLPNTVTANRVNVQENGVLLDPTGLMSRRSVGDGTVIFAAFDLDAMQVWSGAARYWVDLLPIPPKIDVARSYIYQSDNLLRSSLDTPLLQVPPASLIMLLLAGYVILIGPVNFLVLRKMGRGDLAWVTVPVLVVLSLGITYLVNLQIRGTQAQLYQVSLVQGVANQSEGLRTSFAGLFSPQRRTYELSVQGSALFSARSFQGRLFNEEVQLQRDDRSALTDLLVDVGGLRLVLVEQSTDQVPLVDAQVTRTNLDLFDFTLSYNDSLPLEDAMIVYKNNIVSLGTLNPNSQVSEVLALGRSNFPAQMNLSNTEVINRQRVIDDLFGFERFTSQSSIFLGMTGVPTEGVYLLGWRNQPGTEFFLNDQAVRSEGSTLYMIRLDTP